MENQNPLHIPIPNKVGLAELRSVVNVLNQITDDMYDKKVKDIEQNMETNKEEADTKHEENVKAIIEANDLICELAEAM